MMPKGKITNRVFYFTEPEKMEIVTEDCPEPGRGEIRCKTLYSLVSIGTEMICFIRDVEPGSHWDNWIKYPFPPGYSMVGRIEDIGEGVEGFSKGELVCSMAPHREWFVDNAANIFRVPEGLNPELATWFTLNNIVQNGVREVKPILGETAVILGLGPLGQLAVRLLGIAGLKDLVAVDLSPERCALAEAHGPTQTLCSTAAEAEKTVADLTGGSGAHIVLDITGHPDSFQSAHRMLGQRGRLGLIGDVAYPSKQCLTSQVIFKSLKISAAHAICPPNQGNSFYNWGRQEMTDFFFNLISTCRIKIDNLITHHPSPKDAPEIYSDLIGNRGKYMGIVFDWNNF